MAFWGSDASPPPAPDYVGAAKEQGAANVDAARVQGRLNNPNVIGPTGTQTVSYGTFNEPSYNAALARYNQELAAYNANRGPTEQGWLRGTAQSLTNPAPVAPTRAQFTADPDTPTVRQTLSTEQQGLYDQSVQTQQQLGRVAGQGATALEGVVGKPVDFSGAPQTGNYDSTRQSVINAMMGRAQEDYTKRIDQDRSNLVAAGIRPGSKAYADNQQVIERSMNDARQQAEIAGGNAASQAYGMDADKRRQSITELLAQRQTPINEISALMSGSQVSNPFSTPGYAQNSQVQPAPLFAAQNAAGQYGTDVYNAQMASQGNTQSGLFGLGGSGLIAGGLFL